MEVSGKWQIPVQKVDNAAGGSHRNVDFQTPPAGGNVSVYFLKVRINGERPMVKQ